VERAKTAWDEVGASVTDLGQKLKQHLSQAASDAEATGERSDTAARDAVRDAFQKLGVAFEDTVSAISKASKDPEIAEDVRRVGHSVLHAFQSTFEDVSDEVRQAFGRRRGTSGGSADPTPPTPDV
jgi:hypothetical protein